MLLTTACMLLVPLQRPAVLGNGIITAQCTRATHTDRTRLLPCCAQLSQLTMTLPFTRNGRTAGVTLSPGTLLGLCAGVALITWMLTNAVVSPPSAMSNYAVQRLPIASKPAELDNALAPPQLGLNDEAISLNASDVLQIQKSHGPLRFATLKLAPASCEPFAMAFAAKGKRVVANDDIWEKVLATPDFRWQFPQEEGYAVDAIMEGCVPEDGRIPLVLDAGANMGYFSLAAAACGCAAIAYEPHAMCQKFIGASIALNKYGHAVQRRVVAVTDSNKPISFSGWATAVSGSQQPTTGNTVQGIRLDSDVRALSDSHYILYLKVDIQGSEHDAIRGATGLLSQRAVRFVAFEAQLRTQLQSADDAFQQLCSHGYQCMDVQNPKAVIACDASLSQYRDTGCQSTDRLCERYLMCAHEKSRLQHLREYVAAAQQSG